MKSIALTLLLLALATSARSATTINAGNKYAYAGNFGWIDWRGDTNNGAIIGEYVCSGAIYSANVGWISLGNAAPTNGIQYLNLSANDFGVNHDGLGNLRGFAYGANIGWIHFESNGAPRINLANGRLGGFAYSANCGWINLSNAVAFVQTDAIAAGADSDGDGLPDAWERQNFSNLTATAGGDPDADGASNFSEYLAGTDPNNADDVLRITFVGRGTAVADFTTLHWTARPTRFYTIQYRETLDVLSPWLDSIGFGFGASNATFNTGHTNDTEFYRIRAFRPLGP